MVIRYNDVLQRLAESDTFGGRDPLLGVGDLVGRGRKLAWKGWGIRIPQARVRILPPPLLGDPLSHLGEARCFFAGRFACYHTLLPSSTPFLVHSKFDNFSLNQTLTE